MKRLLSIILLALATRFAAAQDSTMVKLDSLIDNYLSFIMPESVEAKQAECDFLIGSVSDSLMRQRIACRLFDKFKDSRVMGDETVAVYVWDKWFADKTIEMPGEDAWFDARMFAEFNRSSLLGLQAPRLKLYLPCGFSFTIPRRARAAIVYFYNIDCGKCKLENEVLPTVLQGWNLDVDFYAVYVGDDKAAWKDFRKSFNPGNPYLKIKHLWDPKVSSDYIRKYGVLATPRIFVIKSDGRIVGRRLEVENIPQMLPFL